MLTARTSLHLQLASFVTRSPADLEKITRSHEKVYSTSSVVHGCFGLVSRCSMPCSRQIWSKRWTR